METLERTATVQTTVPVPDPDQGAEALARKHPAAEGRRSVLYYVDDNVCYTLHAAIRRWNGLGQEKARLCCVVKFTSGHMVRCYWVPKSRGWSPWE